ncbi:hypothetical protein ACHAXA_004171 [Cyclostephanos tholiformis]|uniref:Uncharacterized protein n=1 Tax=Cyclostephanos tholiformis TaxID=382380 RepID=A0ABD3RBL9_9STRA
MDVSSSSYASIDAACEIAIDDDGGVIDGGAGTGGGGEGEYTTTMRGNDNDVRRHRKRRPLIITTPNPDYGCNTHIKFGTMMEYATSKLRADYVATGHYARLWHRDHYASLLSSIERGRYDDGQHAIGGGRVGENDRIREFYRWMDESSREVGTCVMESITGLPEEEWIPSATTDGGDGGHFPMLIAGADRSKDQSYFLSGVNADALRNVIFPLGHLTKGRNDDEEEREERVGDDDDDAPDRVRRHRSNPPSVRSIARDANIPTATKRDSMGICFIGERNFGNFVSQYLSHHPPQSRTTSMVRRRGNFIDVDTGEVVGTHNGRAFHYTLGQGARISGVASRYFVCGRGEGRDGGNADVYVCNSTHHPALYADELYVHYDSFNWIGFGRGGGGRWDAGHERDVARIPRPLRDGRSIEVLARTRHLQPLAPCTVTWERNISSVAVEGGDSGDGRGRFVVRFANPIRAITPGQIVALYAGRDGLICLGGGPIGGRGASHFDRGIGVSLSDLHPSGHNDLSLSHFYR